MLYYVLCILHVSVYNSFTAFGLLDLIYLIQLIVSSLSTK